METIGRSCGICLESFVESDPLINMCSDKTHGGICRNCATSYISNKIESAFLGSCPTMLCPCLHVDKKMRRTLDYKQWRLLVPEKDVKQHTLLADSILAYLCGGCHSLKSLQIVSTEDQVFQAEGLIKASMEAGGIVGAFEIFLEDLNLFSSGDLSVEDFYNRVCLAHFAGTMITGTDKDVWEDFKKILRLVADPERRANLHLRHLRSRPRIWTPCCHREHCFRCRTKDFHDRKSCDENTSSLDQTIISCPSCNIAIAKGDGCNTVFCVCGKQFSWEAEKESLQRSSAFVALYASDTSEASAQLLCDGCSSSLMELAKAWQSRNNVAVSQALLKIWSKRYADCPHQACALLPLASLTEGLREASDLWRQGNSKEVEHCKAMNLAALKAIFTSFYTESERPSAALRILGVSGIFFSNNASDFLRDPRMINSTRLWRDDNLQAFENEVDDWEKRSASQFICLYGEGVPGATNTTCARNPSPIEWDIETSNPNLTFSNNNASAERAGSVSCYPAAFAELPNDRSMITIIIDACPKGTNWLTFGVALKSKFKSYSSDGVGRSRGSWGISDDRSSMELARVCGDGESITSCRKFLEGDRVSAVIDTSEGWCDISINGDEVAHRFDIPLGRAEEYMFVTTFANDHKVTIVPEANDGFHLPGQLNSDHSEMLCCLKRRMRKIIIGDPSVNASSVEVLSAGWVQLTGSERAARGEMAVITPIVEGIIGRVFGKWKGKEFSNPPNLRESETSEPCQPSFLTRNTFSSPGCLLQVKEKSNEYVISSGERTALIRKQLSLKYDTHDAEGEGALMKPLSAPVQCMVASPCASADNCCEVSPHCNEGLQSASLNVDGEKGAMRMNEVPLKSNDVTSPVSSLADSAQAPSVVTPLNSRIQSSNNYEKVLYNWEDLMCAVCWYRVNRNILETAEQWDMAETFLNIHGESAPFIAAAYCASSMDDQSTFECPGEDEKKMALAFMSHFPYDMEGWYEYNASLEEPMLGLERADKNCMCIPRHFKKCPTPSLPHVKSTEGNSKRARRED